MGLLSTSSRSACFVLTFFLTASTPSEAARPAISTESGFFDVIGDIVSAPFKLAGGLAGALVGGATAPMINQAEASGHRLIDDIDSRVNARIGQLNAGMSENISRFDNVLEARLTQFQNITETAILQVDAKLKDRIDQADKVMRDRIGQADLAVGARIGQFADVLQSAVSDVDEVLAKRIADLDEISERRVGNLDTIVSKGALTFEDALLRIVGLGCIILFLTGATWRLHKELSNAPGVRTLQRRVFPQIASMAGLAILLFLGFRALSTARSEAASLEAMHRTALNHSLAIADFPRARFHASQLQILRNDAETQALAMRIDLLRDVFARPTMLMSAASASLFESKVAQIDELLGKPSPDAQSVRAYIIGRLAVARVHEHEAAAYAADALVLGQEVPASDFVLRPLAIATLANYLEGPLEDGFVSRGLPSMNVQRMREALVSATAPDNSARGSQQAAKEILGGPIASHSAWGHVARYGIATRSLLAQSNEMYVDLLAKHVGVLQSKPEEAGAAKVARAKAAKEILDSWQNFYTKSIRGDGEIASSTIPLAVFLLNDAVMARAISYLDPETVLDQDSIGRSYSDLAKLEGTPPVSALTKIGGTDPRILSILRSRVSRDYCAELRPGTRMVLAREEQDRFLYNEVLFREFEVAFVKFKTKIATAIDSEKVNMGKALVLASARLGVYSGGMPIAKSYIDELRRSLPQKYGEKEIEKLEQEMWSAIHATRSQYL